MSIEEHQKDYIDLSWKDYELSELGSWVHNLVKRMSHRSVHEKKIKDLHDAKNYWWMMGELLKQKAELANINWEEL